jgi:hypothetical protein
MKKIVGIVAAASLVAGLAFADPTINVNVAEFTGNAQVQWGVDLDAGATGFKNSEYMKFVINLFDAGSKKTESDNSVWAELVMNAGNTKSWTHRLYQYDKNTDFNADGNCAGIEGSELSFKIDTAKIHFGDFYVGIKQGDTVTGEYKFDGAIRGYDHWKNQGRWMTNVGPGDYSQGIVAGYEDDNMNIAADFRSYEDGQYTDAYAVAAEFKLKDSNSFAEGLSAGVGASYNLADKHFSDSKSGNKATEVKKFDLGYFYNDKNKNNKKDDGEALMYSHLLGYSANVGYKLKIDDTYWLKPQVGLTGWFATDEDADAKTSWQANCKKSSPLMVTWSLMAMFKWCSSWVRNNESAAFSRLTMNTLDSG